MKNTLFTPVKIRSVTFKNRIVVSPMCQYSSVDGYANDWHLVHLGSRAVGGAGLIISEATAVSPEGRISPDDLGIWEDGHIIMLKRITSFISSQGAVAGIQLAHAGRKASSYSPWKSGLPLKKEDGAWQPVAPSAIPFKDGYPMPHELSVDEIQKIQGDFVDAAIRAKQAGFKVIELHAAHGYLLNEFLSPLSNTRNDSYGGSFENRIRMLTETIDQVRNVWNDELPLFVRISSTDHIEGGWTLEDSIHLAKILKGHSVDVMDCSSGGNVSGVRIETGPLYQVKYAERIRKECGIKTGAVGMITTAEEAQMIIETGKADFVLMARELLRDPYFGLHAGMELGVDLEWPPQYERAKKR